MGKRDSKDPPLITGRSPSLRRAIERRGEPAGNEAIATGLVLGLLELEIAVAVALESAGADAIGQVADVLAASARSGRERALALTARLVDLGGSPPRDDEIDPYLVHDARDLGAAAGAEAAEVMIAALARQLAEAYARAAGEVPDRGLGRLFSEQAAELARPAPRPDP